MGIIRKINPVKYFTGMIATNEEDFSKAIGILEKKYGGFDIISKTIPFDFTNYYEEEMGKELLRKFVSMKKLMHPVILPDVKIFTNEIERKFGNIENDKLFRKINLDPGYVSLPKVVLATTKNFSHRIYIRDGIYAEVTLYRAGGKFHSWSWTYPDYKTDFYKDFFTRVREKYMEQLQEEGFRY
ncbi:MAG: DUF4416 family protein [Candidatus Eremiobacteraeota bacterium]|nr:DUF4416 family protein [Candidatus Eremiobacteraeota bacterium]